MATKTELKKQENQLKDKISYLEAEKEKYITDGLIEEIRNTKKELKRVQRALKNK